MSELRSFLRDEGFATPLKEPELLQYLIAVQRRYSHIPTRARDGLARELGVDGAVIDGLVSFYSFLQDAPRGRFDIHFSDNITDRFQGSRALAEQLCARLGVEQGRPREDGRVAVDTTSCTGLSDQGPALLVNGLAIPRLDAARIDAIAARIEDGAAVADWPPDWFRVDDNIRRQGELLGHAPLMGDALRALHRDGPDALLATLDEARLLGRGGAGFPTAKKWRLCRDTVADRRFVVCNADEGEPGTFKDRVLLHRYAHDVVEGMTLCAGVIGARQGFIYLRGEYLFLKPHIEQVFRQRRGDGLLGERILGIEGFNFDIAIHLGAGAYICGEESALIESLEGRPGIPRNRPPFPVTRGYLGLPTVVNNVETFVAASRIAVHGSEWLRRSGTPGSPGTKLHSVSGDCAAPGIYEFEFGTRIRDVLDACGAQDTLCVQVSGAAGTLVPADDFDRRLACEDIPTGGSFMVFDRRRDPFEIVANFADFFVHESCGFCTPCRVGGVLLRDLFTKLRSGHAARADVTQMRELIATMRTTSHCGLGCTAPLAVNAFLERFPDHWQARVAARDFAPAFDLDAALSEARTLRATAEAP